MENQQYPLFQLMSWIEDLENKQFSYELLVGTNNKYKENFTHNL